MSTFPPSIQPITPTARIERMQRDANEAHNIANQMAAAVALHDWQTVEWACERLNDLASDIEWDCRKTKGEQ